MLTHTPKIKLIGRRKFVTFPIFEINKVEAKIDTGAYTCAIHCNKIVLETKGEKQILTFQLLDDRIYRFEEFTRKKIKNSFGEMEERYIIKTLIVMGRKKIKTTISNFVDKIKTFWNYCEPIYECVKKAIDDY